MRTFFFLVRCDERSFFFWCVSVVLVSVFFCAGTSVLFWYWCVHAAGVYYEHTRTPPPGACILVLECAFFFCDFVAYWCWSVHFFVVVVNEYISFSGV